MRYPILSITLAVLAAGPVFAALTACTTAPTPDRAFSRDWAEEHRRASTDKRLKDRRLFVLGQEVRTPDWLDTEKGRAELSIGENNNSSTAVSVDRGELGLRHRWGGSRNGLPAPPGYDERGNSVGGAEQ